MLKSEVKTVKFELNDLEVSLVYSAANFSLLVENGGDDMNVFSKSELENLITILTEAKTWIEEQQ